MQTRSSISTLARIDGHRRVGREAHRRFWLATVALGCVLVAGCAITRARLLSDRTPAHALNLRDRGVVCFSAGTERIGKYFLAVENMATDEHWVMLMNPRVTSAQVDSSDWRIGAETETGFKGLEESYILYSLPSGTYRTAYLRYWAPIVRYSTSDNRPADFLNDDRTEDFWETLWVEPSRFTVRSGEITYIGTYVLEPSREDWVWGRVRTSGWVVPLKDYSTDVRKQLAMVPHLGINRLPVGKELAPLKLIDLISWLEAEAPEASRSLRVARQAQPFVAAF